MGSPYFHVVGRPGGRWEVVRESTGKIANAATEQWRALEVARRFARDEGGAHIVRGDSGPMGPSAPGP